MAVEKHALNKKERALMHVLLNLAEKNDEGVCLVKPLEIFEDEAVDDHRIRPVLALLATQDCSSLRYSIKRHPPGGCP